jgi:hypothetical protein
MSQHQFFKYSLTVKSDDLAFITSLRALAWYCQNEINRQIAVAGAKEVDWEKDGHQVTFYFTSDSNRQNFLKEVEKLFRPSLEIVNQSNTKIPKKQ